MTAERLSYLQGELPTADTLALTHAAIDRATGRDLRPLYGTFAGGKIHVYDSTREGYLCGLRAAPHDRDNLVGVRLPVCATCQLVGTKRGMTVPSMVYRGDQPDDAA